MALEQDEDDGPIQENSGKKREDVARQASGPYPESSRVRQCHAEVQTSMKRAGMGLGAVAAGALLLWKIGRRY
jgi:hypothetical protein